MKVDLLKVKKDIDQKVLQDLINFNIEAKEELSMKCVDIKITPLDDDFLLISIMYT